MRRRRLTVLVLLFLALALSGGAIFIANELARQSTAPDDAAAGSALCCDGGTCSDGRTFGPDTTGIPHSSCLVRANEFCGQTPGSTLRTGGAQIACSTGGGQPPATDNTCKTGNANCVGKAPGTNLDGVCTCTASGAAGNCACIASGSSSATKCSNSTNTASVCRARDINSTQTSASGGSCKCTVAANTQPSFEGGNLVSPCNCIDIPSTPPTTGGGGTTTQGGGTGTTADGASCTTTAQCLPGAYCQGRENARRCQRPAPNQCPGNGTCTGYLAFKCTRLTATGECLDNPLTVSNLSEGLNHSAGCGQVDQVCEGGDRNRRLCGEFIVQDNSCQTTVVIQQPICGSSCSNNSQCPTGMLCNGGACTKPECVGNVCGPDARCGTPLTCGSSCNNNGQCPSGQTCSAGTCVLNTCLTPGNCTGNCQPNVCGDGAVNPGEQCNEPGLTCSASSTCNTSTCLCEAGRCGGTCTSDSQCPSGNTCSNGTCRLDYCLEGAGNCAADNCTPIGCGDQCAPGNLCPNGHTCSDGRCINNACVNGNCDADGCIALPRTNLFAPENRILLSMILIFMGLLIYKSGISTRVVNYLNTNMFNRRDTVKKKFEQKLS